MPKFRPVPEETLHIAYESVGFAYGCRLELVKRFKEYWRYLGFVTPAEKGVISAILDGTFLRLKDKGSSLLQRLEKTGLTPTLSEAADAWLLPRQRFGLLNFEFAGLSPSSPHNNLAEKPVDTLSPDDYRELRKIKSFGPKTLLEIAALGFVLRILKDRRHDLERKFALAAISGKDFIGLFKEATGCSLPALLSELRTPCSRRHLVPILETLSKR